MFSFVLTLVVPIRTLTFYIVKIYFFQITSAHILNKCTNYIKTHLLISLDMIWIQERIKLGPTKTRRSYKGWDYSTGKSQLMLFIDWRYGSL